MNIENVAALVKQLDAIGLENTTSALLKRISFHPETFMLERTVGKGSEVMRVQLHFKKLEGDFGYALNWYDAILPGEPQRGEETINGVSVLALESEMDSINWRGVFELDEDKVIILDDKKTWQQEDRVEKVVIDLTSLEAMEEGKQIAALLKQKHWSGFAHVGVTGNLVAARDKGEISQRFYPQNGQYWISLDEAYRFLQNRRLEKQILATRRRLNETEPGNEPRGEQRSNHAGSLRKGMRGKQKKDNQAYRSKAKS